MDFGLSGPIPKDILVLLGVTFLSYALGAFASTRPLIDLLQLGPGVLRGFLWQLVTYPAASSYDQGALGFLITLWMILVFGKQVFGFVGRKAFWRHFVISALVAGVIAVLVERVMALAGSTSPFVPFTLMQGRAFILAFLITGFATLYGNATIYFMFVLPLKASWFIGLEILLAFLLFLSYQDFAGFIGICAAVGASYMLFSGRGPMRFFHETRLRIERRILERKLRKMRGKGGDGDGGGLVQGPWVN